MAILKNAIMTAEVDPKGATVQKLYCDDVCVAQNGFIAGRFANRIARAELPLNGKIYHLAKNENENILHGGPGGFQTRTWEETVLGDAAAEYRLVSEDGDQGFPGRMEVTVRYELTENSWKISYEAVCDQDTAINLTNHAFFNLNGVETPLFGTHSIAMAADSTLDIDAELIPTGKLYPVEGTRFDLRQGRVFDGLYDHCFVLNGRDCGVPAAVAQGAALRMEVFTDQPAMQLYNLDTFFCLESQAYPDAVHYPQFPSAILKAGEVFRTATEYRFTKK